MARSADHVRGDRAVHDHDRECRLRGDLDLAAVRPLSDLRVRAAGVQPFGAARSAATDADGAGATRGR